jgi:hypothetical protein
MKNKTLLILLIGCFLLSSPWVVSAATYQYSAPIQNQGTQKYKAVRLSNQVISACQYNLADLKLVNSKDEEVPFFLHEWKEIQDVIKKAYNMKRINSFVKESWQYFDFALETPVEGDIQANSLQVYTNNRSYAKEAQVYGSYDANHWTYLQKTLLYSVDTYTQDTISFDSVQKYTHYRLQIPHGGESIDFTSAKLHFDQELVQKEYFIDTFEAQFSTEEVGTTTVITLYNMKNLSISEITLVTDELFHRTVRYETFSPEELYNLRFTDQNYQKLTLHLNGWKEPEDTRIIVRRFAHEIVFEGENETAFTLLFGSPTLTQKPQYDIGRYREGILQEGYDELTLGLIQEETTSPDRTKSQQQIFNIIIIAIVLLLGTALLFRLKKTNEKITK